jgi:hypothetical protein
MNSRKPLYACRGDMFVWLLFFLLPWLMIAAVLEEERIYASTIKEAE